MWLEMTEVEKDLGVMISSDGRNNKQVELAVSKANRALGRTRKTFKYFNIQLFKVLYPAFVRHIWKLYQRYGIQCRGENSKKGYKNGYRIKGDGKRE